METPSNVVNLMDALKRSLASEGKGGSAGKASIAKASIGKASVGKASIGKAAVGKAANDGAGASRKRPKTVASASSRSRKKLRKAS